jgi:hypothetical protein
MARFAIDMEARANHIAPDVFARRTGTGIGQSAGCDGWDIRPHYGDVCGIMIYDAPH